MTPREADAASDFVVFGHWYPATGKSEELVEAFKPILNYIAQDTENITCYYLLQEEKEDGTGTIVAAASFKNEDAYKQYLKTPERSALDTICDQKGLLAKPQFDQLLNTATGFPLRPTETPPSPNLHTVAAKIQYAPGTRADGIEHWKTVTASVEETEKEGTFTYWFLEDPEDADVLYSLERYKDKSYLWDVHVPSEAIQQNMQKQKDIRTGLELRVFKTQG